MVRAADAIHSSCCCGEVDCRRHCEEAPEIRGSSGRKQCGEALLGDGQPSRPASLEKCHLATHSHMIDCGAKTVSRFAREGWPE